MRKIKTAIAGSFKFKKEIDDLHEEFADYGVEVLEPTKGWLYIPAITTSFRPLPEERGIPSIRQIEDRFLGAIRRSDFLYLFNHEQYLGVSSSFEVGFALACNTPVFASEPITLANFEYELDTWEFLKSSIRVATPKEASELIHGQL